ncbi:hypothetical protein B0I12_002533 [Microbacterium hydrothermale]|uniref:hypothetical protein n=1 Tax=Microbacterium hydrothermale TaxID=857427 RepID=UPI0022261F03|nr:hypothetical protein [Microbacterium hydrothermale]MCW2165378.1 hypothetical protein [Microbacterium hydrothermale]
MTEAVCIVTECGRPARTLNRTLCTTHYNRTKTGQSLDAPVRAFRRQSGPCRAEGCDRVDSGSHGYCNTHILRLRRHGSLELPPYRKADHPRWTGSEATYSAVHQRLRQEKGRADQHQCIDCSKVAHHWSYTHDDPNERAGQFGAYSVDLSRYVPRCASCHKRFDMARRAA